MPVQNPSPPPPPPLIISQQEGLAACARSTDNPQHSAPSLPLPSLQPSGARTNGARGNGRESHTPPPAPGRSLLGRSPQRTRAHERARTRTNAHTDTEEKKVPDTHNPSQAPAEHEASSKHARARVDAHSTPSVQKRPCVACCCWSGQCLLSPPPVRAACCSHRLCVRLSVMHMPARCERAKNRRLVTERGRPSLSFSRHHQTIWTPLSPAARPHPVVLPCPAFFFERALSLRPIDNRAHRISDRSIATHRSDVALGAKLDCPSRVLCLHFWLLFPVLLCLSVFPLSLLKGNLKTCQRFQL